MMAPQVCFISEINTQQIDSRRSRSEVSVNQNIKPKVIRDRDRSTGKEGFLWLGGGGAYLLNDRYIVLVLRDSKAPSNPNKLTVATGLSDGPGEWINPNLLMRELFEEVLLIENNDTILVPKVVGYENLASEAISSVKDTESKMEMKIIPSTFYSNLEDELVVNGERFDGMFCVDRESKSVNFMKVVKIEKDLNSISFLDTERDENGDLLGREIFLFDIKEGQLLKDDFEVVENTYLYTTHSEYLIKKLMET